MKFDEAKFQEFKALSVQSVDQLVVGQTYYTNIYPKEFTLKDVVTWAEMNRRENRTTINDDDDVTLQWMEYTGEFGDRCYASCHDMNIDDCYNPWLVFTDKETAERCIAELNSSIKYEPDPFDDYPNYEFDEIDYGWYSQD